MAGEVVNSSFVHLSKFVASGQESALKTATSHIRKTFSRHRLRLVGRTDGGLHPAFYSSPNGDIVEHRICEITRDSGYPPPPATSQILRPLAVI